MEILASKSLRNKVAYMLMFTAGLAMVLAAACFLTFEVFSLRKEAAANLRSLGAIVANNASPALAFHDPGFAAKILESLKDRKHLTSARIYAADGSVLARFPPGEAAGEEALSLARTQERVGPGPSGNLVLTRFIQSEEGLPIGVLRLEADQGEIVDRVKVAGAVLGGITLLLGLLAAFFAFLFQGVLTRPILGLVEVVSRVSATQDYRLRAARGGEDELGLLSESINTMLARIQDQDLRLAHHREHLEHVVAQRTAELVQANNALQVAKDHAEASSHAKSSFLANMSHELRTPLNAILLYSEVIRNEAEDAGVESIHLDAGRVEAAGRHLLHLINDLLDMAKIESGKMTLVSEPFAVRELLDDVLSTVANLASRNGNAVTMACAPALGEMVADSTRVRQVLLNLLSNACKFTREGSIHLEAGIAKAGDDGPEWASFAVSDTGIGIAPEQVERIFNEFIQGDDSTTRRFGGTGLGLSLSRKFCQMMGGEVRVRSVLGQGSTFTVLLPLSPLADPPREGAPALASGHAQGHCVLLVDDDSSLLDSLSRLLTRDGFHVRTARDGREGLEMARRTRPGIIVLDVILPHLDGWEVLSALKADPDLAAIPVVMLTIVDEAEKGLSLGAVDYLSKPLDRGKLSQVLSRHLPPAPLAPVLVVEDDLDTREAMVRILRSDGLPATTAGDGLEALEQLEREPPSAVLLDLMMPKMDGFRFLAEKQANPEWADIPLVVVTARELTDEDRGRLKASGVEAMLQKGSYCRADLLEEVRRLVNRNHPGIGDGGAP